MRILEIHLEVNDLEKSLELYKKLLPHKRVKAWKDGSAAALVLEDNTALGLWKKDKLGIYDGRGAKHLHFAFEIKNSQYNVYKQKVIDAGLEALEHDWKDGRKSIYFFDYDGHQGEFMTGDWSNSY